MLGSGQDRVPEKVGQPTITKECQEGAKAKDELMMMCRGRKRRRWGGLERGNKMGRIEKEE